MPIQQRHCLLGVAAVLATLGLAANAQSQRPAPRGSAQGQAQAPKVTASGIPRTPIVKLVTKAPPATFLSAAKLRQRFASAGIPDLTSAFSLTPAAQSVHKRGSLTINGDVSVPNPLPPGFPGQARLRHLRAGMGGPGVVMGVAFMTIEAKKDVFYAIDCLAETNGNDNVNYVIKGAGPTQSGVTKIAGGHFVLTMRKTDGDGPIKLELNPDKWDHVTGKNEMDFWGCQISTGT